jgi:hypothetical protein
MPDLDLWNENESDKLLCIQALLDTSYIHISGDLTGLLSILNSVQILHNASVLTKSQALFKI